MDSDFLGAGFSLVGLGPRMTIAPCHLSLGLLRLCPKHYDCEMKEAPMHSPYFESCNSASMRRLAAGWTTGRSQKDLYSSKASKKRSGRRRNAARPLAKAVIVASA